MVLNNFLKLSPLERRFRDIQIVIITIFVVVSSVGIYLSIQIINATRQLSHIEAAPECRYKEG